MAVHKDKAPRQIGGMAVDFAVHQIAETNQGTYQRNGYHQAVKSP